MQPMILSRSKKKARTYVLAFLEFTSLDLLNVSSLRKRQLQRRLYSLVLRGIIKEFWY